MEIIHIVLGKANPARMNGVNKVVNELATKQALAGHQVALWGITANPEHNYPERPYQTALYKAYRNKFRLDKALIEDLRKKKTAVFHLHGGFVPTFYAIAKVLDQQHIEYVFTPHGSYNVIALQKSKWQKKLYFFLYEKSLLKKAKAIHCLGKSEVSGLQQLHPNNKALLIPYGFEFTPTVKLPAYSTQFVVGFCGRIDIYTKGLDLLLNAFAQLKIQVPAAKLWIIGDSAELPQLKKMAASLELTEATTFWGSQFGEKKFDLLQQMQVFAHPSRNEGLPTAVLEAASLGIPCAVTEATNVGDTIRQYGCGEVIAQPDASALAAALLNIYTIIQQKGPGFLSGRAEQMVSEAYNWNHILQQFTQLYQRA